MPPTKLDVYLLDKLRNYESSSEGASAEEYRRGVHCGYSVVSLEAGVVNVNKVRSWIWIWSWRISKFGRTVKCTSAARQKQFRSACTNGSSEVIPILDDGGFLPERSHRDYRGTQDKTKEIFESGSLQATQVRQVGRVYRGSLWRCSTQIAAPVVRRLLPAPLLPCDNVAAPKPVDRFVNAAVARTRIDRASEANISMRLCSLHLKNLLV
jgi:hypothetical protein